MEKGVKKLKTINFHSDFICMVYGQPTKESTNPPKYLVVMFRGLLTVDPEVLLTSVVRLSPQSLYYHLSYHCVNRVPG